MSEQQGKGRVTLKTYFEADKMPREGHFADLIDASLNKIDDQLFINVAGEGENNARFLGIGSTDPQSPLSIRNRTGDAKRIGLEDSGGDEEWHISINPPDGNNGFLIASNDKPEASLLVDADGKIGIGTHTPQQKLHIEDPGDTFISLSSTGSNGSTANLGTVNSNGKKETQLQFENEFGLYDHVLDIFRFVIKEDGNIGIGTSAPQEKLHVEGDVKAHKFEGNLSWNYITDMPNLLIPAGAIILWSGSVANIPEGWELCDGYNGTPDLLNRFIVGAGDEYVPDQIGGQKQVTLTIGQMPKHNHRLKDGKGGQVTNSILGDGGKNDSPCLSGQNTGTEFVNQTVSNQLMTKTGGNAPHENRPPYYALCYIMKL